MDWIKKPVNIVVILIAIFGALLALHYRVRHLEFDVEILKHEMEK